MQIYAIMAIRGGYMDKSIVGERLKALREGVRLSQAKLAAQFKDVDQPAIFRYERGYSFPPYHVLMQYADYFDVSLDYIFGRRMRRRANSIKIGLK